MRSIPLCCSIYGFILVSCWFELQISASSRESANSMIEFDVCREDIGNTVDERYLNEFDTIFIEGGSIELQCEVQNRNATSTFRWFYNCQEKLPPNAFLQMDGFRLIITNVTYTEHPGLYSCILENEQSNTPSALHYHVCLEPPMIASTSLSCSNVAVVIGQPVRLVCDIEGGFGATDSFDFIAYISRVVDGRSCNASVDSDYGMDFSNDSCSLTMKEAKTPCFGNSSEPPTEEQMEDLKTRLQFVYDIGNVELSDIGQYIVTIDFDRGQLPLSAYVMITQDNQPRMKMASVTNICLILVAVCAVIVLILVRFCFGLECLWVCSKILKIGKTDTITDSVYLAYHYSNLMTLDSSSMVKSLVFTLTDYVERRGGTIFDGYREPSNGAYKPEMIIDNICRFVVIILTSEFLQDEWRVFEVLQVCKYHIENGDVKILYIRVQAPGQHVLDVTEENSSIAPLLRLVKAHPHEIVDWNGKLPFSFRTRVQLDLFFQDHSCLNKERSSIRACRL